MSRTIQAEEDAAIRAIVSGKRSLAPGLQAKARQLQEEVQVATETFQTLAKPLSLIEVEEAGRAAEAERNRVAHLMSEYRNSVAQLIRAIESGADALAPYRIQVAEAALADVALEIPKNSRPPVLVVENASMMVIDPLMRLNFLGMICNSGFAELLPKDHRGRVIFEHQQAHDEREAKRPQRERIIRGKIADNSIIPDELPYAKHRMLVTR